jgi:hypothetical protein
VGGKVAEGLVGELFRIAFERRHTGPLVGYGIDTWGLPSVLLALAVLFSVAIMCLLLPLILRETALSPAAELRA